MLASLPPSRCCYTRVQVVVVGQLTWVLGTEPGSTGRAVCTLNYPAISPARVLGIKLMLGQSTSLAFPSVFLFSQNLLVLRVCVPGGGEGVACKSPSLDEVLGSQQTDSIGISGYDTSGKYPAPPLYLVMPWSPLHSPMPKAAFPGQRDGSVIKSIYCSLRGPEFGSQHPY